MLPLPTLLKYCRPAQECFAAVAEAISQFEPVIVCANAEQVTNVRAVLPDHIQVVEVPQDDAWFRDTGPTVGDSPFFFLMKRFFF